METERARWNEQSQNWIQENESLQSQLRQQQDILKHLIQNMQQQLDELTSQNESTQEQNTLLQSQLAERTNTIEQHETLLLEKV